MAMAVTHGALSDSDHSAQLRKAVIASTIGTTIEWYDFFLYGTAAGSDLRQALLSQRDPLTATLAAFGTYFHRLRRTPDRRRDIRPLRRPHRPQGDADRHAAVHGHRHLPDRLRADLRVDRHLGRRHPDRPADDPGHRRRRRVGRLGAAGDGMVAHPRSARPGRILAAIRRAVRAVPRRTSSVLAFSHLSGDQFIIWGWRIPFALSIVLIGIGLWIRLGILETPVFQQAGGRARRSRRRPIFEVIQEAAEGDHAFGPAAGGRAGAVLYLHRLHLRLCRRHAAYVARPDSERGAGRVLCLVHHHSAVRAISPTASGGARCI